MSIPEAQPAIQDGGSTLSRVARAHVGTASTPAALAFLRRRNRRINLVTIDPTDAKPTAGMTLDPADSASIRRAKGFLADALGLQNIYWSPNAPVPHLNKKASEWQIAELWAIHCDVDPREGQDYGTERHRLTVEMADKLKAMERPPTLIIDSGNGIQLVWEIDRPIPASEETVTRFKSLGKACGESVGGDAVENVDRIIRVPFTLNLPTKKKRMLGRPVSTAVSLHEGRAYDPAELDQVTEELRARSLAHPEIFVPRPRSASAPCRASSDEVQALIDQIISSGVLHEAQRPRAYELARMVVLSANDLGVASLASRRLAGDTTGLIDISRSGLEMAIAACLKRWGWKVEDVARAMLDCPATKAADPAEWKDDYDRARAIARAFARVELAEPEQIEEGRRIYREKIKPRVNGKRGRDAVVGAGYGLFRCCTVEERKLALVPTALKLIRHCEVPPGEVERRFRAIDPSFKLQVEP